ncbi:EI24 domain-containing protein [Nitrosophilus alvini]|uniref:EI24 domain-containing protein n=1 Tax=Nitrosophilus alvini TaxID=2714855 RepID=UPI00190BA906|nr:EI24 domain-containing protein [Nitrosophilus alvini]
MGKNIFILALEDFLSTKFLALTTVPFFATLIIAFVLLFQISGEFFDLLNSAVTNPDAAAVQGNELAEFLKEYPFLSVIFGSFIFKAIAGTFFYIIGGGLAIMFSTIVAVIVIGFFTSYIVAEIHKRHYRSIDISSGYDIFSYIWFVLKSLALFMLFFIVTLPFYFIPVINLVAINAPFYFLFSRLLAVDVAGEIFAPKEFEQILRENRKEVGITTLILYLISLLPFAGMLLQVYFVSVLTHLFFNIKKERISKKSSPKEIYEAEIVE